MQGHIDPQVAAKIASQPAARPAAATAPLGQAADPLEAALDRLGSHVAARKTARKSV
jgi:hypothetical protein